MQLGNQSYKKNTINGWCSAWRQPFRYSIIATILLGIAACSSNTASQNEKSEALKAASTVTVIANASPVSIKQGESFDISVTVQSTRSTMVDVLVGIKKPDGSSAYSAKLTGQSVSATSPIKIMDSITIEQTDPVGVYSLYVTVAHCGTSKVIFDALDAAEITVEDTSCTPNCSGKQCGSDECGGSCGTCTAPQTCNSDNVCAEETAGIFDIWAPLALDKSTVQIGETVQGTVTYRNNSRIAVSVQDIVITSRPPNGTNADGPYMNFAPRTSSKTVQPGETIQLSASVTFTSSDSTGRYRAYATYQDAAGIWHDGPNVDFTVTSTPCVPTTCEAQGKNCGSIANGCGGTLSCGSCTAPQSCSSENVCIANNENPSGEPMPIGNISGWRQVFTDDFTTDVSLGGFPRQVNSKWSAYPEGWRDTSGNGAYNPSKVISVHDGVLDLYIHTENGEHLVAAPVPAIPGAPGNNGGLLYGRYVVRFRADPIPGYKTAWLLWPDSETWPQHGEIDFPEGNLDGTISAFMHRWNGTSGSDQDAFSSNQRYTSWHTAIIEWTPGQIDFILDGTLIGRSTSRIPQSPMHWVLQTETNLDGYEPSDSAQGHVQIDWVAVYVPQ